VSSIYVAEVVYELSAGEIGGTAFDIVRWDDYGTPTQCWGDPCYGVPYRGTDTTLGLCASCTDDVLLTPPGTASVPAVPS
jgi:hypothetical protein